MELENTLRAFFFVHNLLLINRINLSYLVPTSYFRYGEIKMLHNRYHHGNTMVTDSDTVRVFAQALL